MSTFSSLLSSLDGQNQTPKQSSSEQHSKAQAASATRSGDHVTTKSRAPQGNLAAGVKRRSEEPEVDTRLKAVKIAQDTSASKAIASGPSSRFQLSSKPTATQRLSAVPAQSTSRVESGLSSQRNAQKPIPKTTAIPATSASTAIGTGPARRGFASIMEKAKAAQEAAKVAGSTSIRHKPVEKVSKRDRLRMMEEAKTQRKATSSPGRQFALGKKNAPDDHKRGTHADIQQRSSSEKVKMSAEAISYKGTMRPAAAVSQKRSQQKGQPQDRNGGYADWSDLDDAEEDDGPDNDSDVSSDMEGGFDALEEEETAALRVAQKEDKEALEEEERLKRDKLERKRRLQSLNKSAAAKRKF